MRNKMKKCLVDQIKWNQPKKKQNSEKNKFKEITQEHAKNPYSKYLYIKY